MTRTLLALLLAAEPPDELRKASEMVTSPVVVERVFSYDVEGAIRLGFFWLSRRGVGSATWRFGRTEKGCRLIALAAGSDPSRAPMRINRWGTMTEVHDPRTGETVSFGVMKITHARTMKGVREEVALEGSPESTRYDLMLALKGRQEFVSTAGAFYHRSDLALRERDSITPISLAKALEGALPIKRGTIANQHCLTGAGTVLFALSDSVNEALDKPVPLAAKCYIHNGREFDVALEKVSRMVHPTYGKVMVARFTIVRRNTGERNRLELTVGESGDLRGYPVELRYQPNYWFRLRFTLHDGSLRPGQR